MSDIEDLRQSEEKYRGLFLRNKAPTLIIDGSSGRIVDANPAALSFYLMDRAGLDKLVKALHLHGGAKA